MDEDLAKKLTDILNEKNININEILENFQANSSDENTNNTQSNNQFDAETLLKIQNLLKILNSKKDSNDEQLLRSLKPYLRESKKTKVDQYIKLLHILKLFENFQEMGGNINDFL